MHRRLTQWLVRDADVELTALIVESARREVLARFPGATFRVLFWDSHSRHRFNLEEAIASLGVEVERVSDLIPDLADAPLKYQIHPADAHPSAAAYALLASHVSGHVRGRSE